LGRPQEQPDAADRALEAAANIISGLYELHATLEPAVKDLFGNKGASVQLDYGILGDIVNGAARIESLTKYYGVRMIITREVVEKATKKPPVRFLDRIRVKGKTKPLEMFEVLIEPAEEKLALVKVYESAWKKYESGDFAGAATMLDELKASDKPSKVLADRCHEMEAARPPDWDGAYQFKEK
jgi:adenylate cyclase